MPKWIKGRNGKFLGSVGRGKRGLPTPLPPLPPMKPLTPLGDPLVDGPELVTRMKDTWTAWKEPTAERRWKAALIDLGAAHAAGPHHLPAAIHNLAHTGEQLAATPAGQVTVLTQALRAAGSSDLVLANALYDATIHAQAQHHKDRGMLMLAECAAVHAPTPDQAAENLITEFRTLAATPFTGTSDGRPIQYPFNGIETAAPFAQLAQLVADNTDGLYPPGLTAEAQDLAATDYIAPHAEDPRTPHPSYLLFILRVQDAHRANPNIVTARIQRRLAAAETAQRLTAAEHPAR